MTVTALKARKETHTMMDTIVLTSRHIEAWKIPPFQRPLREGPALLAVVEELKQNHGVIPGVITIGILSGEEYLVDAQHRCHAFRLSGLTEGFADIRYVQFDSMAEMAQEFVRLNRNIVKMTADDVLRGIELRSEGLQLIRAKCPFVGYTNVGRRPGDPILSMSKLLRAWFSSAPQAPGTAGIAATVMAEKLLAAEAEECVRFLRLALRGWGKDPEYKSLWGTLNLTLCMWLFRRVVLEEPQGRALRLTADQFGKCLASLSAESAYLDWLVGRKLHERDRSPCYGRIKLIFRKRLTLDGHQKPFLPQPEWLSHQGHLDRPDRKAS